MESRSGAVSAFTVIRSGGVALMMGGVFLALYIVLQVVAGSPRDPENVTNTAFSVAHHLRVAGAVFLLFGLVALLFRFVGRIAPFGLTAFALAFAGTALFGGESHTAVAAHRFIAESDAALYESFLRSPAGAVLGLAGMLLLLIGYVMLGIVLFRAGLSPRWSTVTLPLGWVILATGPPGQPLIRLVGGLLVAVSFLAQGWELWSRPAAAPQQAGAGSA